MTSFGWKRKASSLSSTSSKSKAFSESDQDNHDQEDDPDFDWIAVAKKKRFEALEDNKTLFTRLKQEGVTLAEEEKYWQAVGRWDNALSLDPTGKLPTYGKLCSC